MAKQEYIDKNRRWLAEKANEPGVQPLDKGIYYKILKRGNGPSPNRNSVVTVHTPGALSMARLSTAAEEAWLRHSVCAT